jgi:hypothetical protein
MVNMSALLSPDVLHIVFQFADLSQWLFLGGVCKAWAAAVLHQPQGRNHSDASAAAAQAKTTRFSAVAESASRIAYACTCDKSCSTRRRLLAFSKAAAWNGCSDALSWCELRAGRWLWRSWHQDLVLTAVCGNQFATLQRLLASQRRWNVATAAPCAAYGKRADTAMLQWSVSLKTDWRDCDIDTICSSAAAGNSPTKLDWLGGRFPRDRLLLYDVVCASIRAGALQSLQWLAAAGVSFDNQYYSKIASACNQLAVLQYLIDDVHCLWDSAKVREAAAATGALATLQWLANRDAAVLSTAVLTRLLDIAGQHGNLAAAQWLRAQGAEWPTAFVRCDWQQIGYYKTSYWQLNTMQWARANGCPWGAWSGDTCKLVCVHERYSFSFNVHKMQQLRDAMVWAHAAGCPCNDTLHRRVTERLHGEHKRAQRLDAAVFRQGFCVRWCSVLVLAVKSSFLAVLLLKLYALASANLADDNVGGRVVCIGVPLFFLLPVLLILLLSILSEVVVY